MIPSKVRSEWSGEVGGEGAGTCLLARSGVAVCGLSWQMSITLFLYGTNAREVVPNARLTYALIRRIKFQYENIFAELMLGWWVSNESTNHS